MFRKRDNDSMESENEIDPGAEVEADSGVKAEAESEAEAGSQVDADSKPEPERDVQPAPEIQFRSETPKEPDPAAAAPVDPPADPPIDPPSEPDLPESEPLSAATKPAAASVSPTASSEPQANKRLIVGQGIRLSGEINSCDRLVVEGEVEVTLNDTLALEITSSGRFTGGCEVEEADISGIYEGDLTVRNTLFVRGSGRITGTIRYGQLELERGGQIAGNISVLGNDASIGGGDGAKVRSAKAPLFGGSNG
ncbi:MAG: polymer-forming cytoskeletal protein [Alphaproteobacteria bacterium]|nr:polymer-forming cytoskeletal protein [Alphaproteobacteria bacterium]